MALFIGFANKYYTLWEVTESTRQINESVTQVITHHQFIKNISFDQNKAIAKYPEAKFDLSLKGVTKSWKSYTEVWNNVDTFRFGRSKYNKIETEDISYVEWYWNSCVEEQKEYVGNYLISKGYEIRENEYINHNNEKVISKYLVSPEVLENERKEIEKMNEFLDTLIVEEKIEFCPTTNLSEDGDYTDGKVVYRFPEIKQYFYDGFPYYLPAVKGKGKRIKNKTIIIKDFNFTTVDGKILIEINEFEIVK